MKNYIRKIGVLLLVFSILLVNVQVDPSYAYYENDQTFSIGTGVGLAAGTDNGVKAIATQADGKILIGGKFTSYNGTTVGYIARLNADGSIDTSFNTGGAGFDNTVRTIAVQSDGKILVGGSFTTYNGTTANRVVRLDSNGVIDPGFVYGVGFDGNVNNIVLQGTNIYVGGAFNNYNGTGASRIVRLDSNGVIDLGFVYGVGFDGNVNTIVLQGTNIYVGGAFNNYNGTGAIKIARLLSSGVIDGTFTTTGLGLDGTVNTIAVQPDNNILVGGNFTTYDVTPASKIIRLLSSGAIDPGFNYGTGFTAVVAGLKPVNSIVVQSDGKILIGGLFTSYNGTSVNNIVQLNPNGTLDSLFSPATGVRQTANIGLTSTVNAIALQSGNKILIGGIFDTVRTNGGVSNQKNLTRLNNTGTGVDLSLATTGVLSPNSGSCAPRLGTYRQTDLFQIYKNQELLNRINPTNLIQNGDFNSLVPAVGSTILSANYGTAIPSWTLSDNGVAIDNLPSVITSAGTLALPGKATDQGATIQSLFLNYVGASTYTPVSYDSEGFVTNTPALTPVVPLTISQTITTIPGNIYKLQFYVTGEGTVDASADVVIGLAPKQIKIGNFVFSPRIAMAASKLYKGALGVNITGYSQVKLVVPTVDDPLPGITDGGMRYEFEFKATSTSTTISFENRGNLNASSPNLILDDVIVNDCGQRVVITSPVITAGSIQPPNPPLTPTNKLPEPPKPCFLSTDSPSDISRTCIYPQTGRANEALIDKLKIKSIFTDVPVNEEATNLSVTELYLRGILKETILHKSDPVKAIDLENYLKSACGAYIANNDNLVALALSCNVGTSRSDLINKGLLASAKEGSRDQFFQTLFRTLVMKDLKLPMYNDTISFNIPLLGKEILTAKRTLISSKDVWVPALQDGAGFYQDPIRNQTVIFAHSAAYINDPKPTGRLFFPLLNTYKQGGILVITQNGVTKNYVVKSRELVHRESWQDTLVKDTKSQVFIFTCDRKDNTFRQLWRLEEA